MWYETNWFVIVMMVLSVLMLYSSTRRLKMNFDQAVEDFKDSISNSEGFGKHAVVIFTGIILVLMVGYIAAAGVSGLIPFAVVYALMVVKLLAVMIEYGGMKGVWGYGKKTFAFDKIQCWVNIATAITIIARFFITGIVRI